ncbi:putative ubiquitin-protein ligase ASI1 KNAG_0E02280 [Huiozyma naganishii CBS 8797]|uniref:RING-type domain-containing protein n=1 Tax=Huiozyma naganishii (strain ATCC MYA-139 / BCRC 22969 / CBS 8797 / KCTC 17520 / NBRC 10181 / NCYC 3082 / Yp74L-3) TaxID=1071383 RepID=J7S6P7_HUIN7|nr:hypothetical protein KNAG_0E02280 [Kazachstania naganishii CBS 8797]CCK70489.1 hypothetical protein KNAG_0E02280 [Kazachstania naganishii CBS 8797]
MNITSHSSIFDEIGYLNQTNHYLVTGDSIFARLLNGPYKFLYTLHDAVQQQYTEAQMILNYSRSDGQQGSIESTSPWEPLAFLTNFFSTKYAVVCLVFALLMNKYVMNSTQRPSLVSRGQLTPSPIPKWGVYSAHSVSIFSLLYMMVVPFQRQVDSKGNLDIYLFSHFIVFTASNVVETVFSIQNNMLPLESPDFSIFELAIQSYKMLNDAKFDGPLNFNLAYLPDLTLALVGRLVIHIVDVFQLRKYRLFASTVVNCIHSGVLTYILMDYGASYIPLTVRIRHFPKVFFTMVSLLSLSSYAAAVLVRWNPFHDMPELNTEELQFHSFVHNWWSHLNLTGEEDYFTAMKKLALLLCLGIDSKDKHYNRELPSVTLSDSLNKNFKISRYLIDQTGTILDQVEPSVRFGRVKHSKTAVGGAIISLWNIVVFLFRLIFPTRTHKDHIIKPSWPKSSTTLCATRQNVSNWGGEEQDEVGWIADKSDDSDDSDDNDEEYVLDNNSLDEPNLTSHSDSDSDSDLGIDDVPGAEFFELLTPPSGLTINDDLQWVASTSAILQAHLSSASRVTRFNYEKQAHLHAKDSTDNFNDEIDHTCAICKTNPRDIILWPCKCFAICSSCKVSLALRGYKTCICCRRTVSGFSKVHYTHSR